MVSLSLELTVLDSCTQDSEVGAQPESEEKLGGKQTGASTCRVCMRTVTWPYALLWVTRLEQRTCTTWGGSKDSTKLQRTVLYLMSQTMSWGQRRVQLDSCLHTPALLGKWVLISMVPLLEMPQSTCNISHQMCSGAYFLPLFSKFCLSYCSSSPYNNLLFVSKSWLKSQLPPGGSFSKSMKTSFQTASLPNTLSLPHTFIIYSLLHALLLAACFFFPSYLLAVFIGIWYTFIKVNNLLRLG